MSIAGSILTCSFQRLNIESSLSRPSSLLGISKQKGNSRLLRNQTLRLFGTGLKMQNDSNIRRDDVVVYSSAQPGPPLPSDPSPGSWKVWILGMIVTVIIPFWRNKWGPFLQLKNQVEAVVETVEHVADIIEEVAEQVEKVADEIGDNLPNGNLKSAADFIENLAKKAGDDAELAGDVIDKVQEVQEEVESFLEPIIDQVNETTNKDEKDQPTTAT